MVYEVRKYRYAEKIEEVRSFPRLENGKQGIQNFKIKRIMCLLYKSIIIGISYLTKQEKNERHCKKLIDL